MGYRIDYREKVKGYGFPKRLEDELLVLFSENVDRIHSQTRRSLKKLSTRTQEWRLTYICAMLKALRDEGGFKLMSPWTLKQKHIEWIVSHSVRKGQAVGTIENKLTYLRALAVWMNKPNLVLTLDDYVNRAETGMKRHYTAQEDLSWSAKEIDIDAEIRAIEEEDRAVGLQLRLMWGFGLRVEEALKLRPAAALRDGALYVDEGSKGGRKRLVPITRPDEQYGLLVAAARLANSRTGSTIPAAYTYDRWEAHFRSLMEKYGVTKKGRLGRTPHGLRHEYMHGLYEHVTGAPAPVKDDARKIDPEVHREGQRWVAEAAGHSRLTKANAYLSTYATQADLRRPVVTPKQAAQAVVEQGGNKSKAAECLGISRPALYRLLERHDAGDQS